MCVCVFFCNPCQKHRNEKIRKSKLEQLPHHASSTLHGQTPLATEASRLNSMYGCAGHFFKTKMGCFCIYYLEGTFGPT